ncbi:nuclear transport factor 2 family protein [Paraburkholderia hospita]|uniref:nuclear transport factor 2 family protein n=1 Tax=Paraburkholderia hospita TaxID=169430 RepID=UPI000B3417B2|nr:nuclear transport factor 2 family protein [Paraburkholderia hospita]OUL89998.1 hypothetical protein CA603_18035 [Paraburkholderia hospita]
MNNAESDFWQMSNLTAEFYDCLDRRDYAGVLGCFTQNGIWHRRGSYVQGREAIKAALEARPSNFHTSHLVSNVRVQQTSPMDGAVSFCMSGYPYIGDLSPGEYAAPPRVHLVAMYRDVMKKLDGRWLIVEKKCVRIAYKDDQHLP